MSCLCLFNYEKRLLIFLSFFTLIISSCVSSIEPQKKIYYEPNRVISKGEPVNYTAMMKRVLDLKGKELSKNYDTGIQSWITDMGVKIIYVEGDKTYEFFEAERSDKFHKDWDRVYYSDACIVYESKIQKDKKVISKKVRPNLSARITDRGYEIEYIEKGETLIFLKAKFSVAPHEDWGKIYYTKDKKFGMLKSTKKNIYRLFYRDTSGNDRTYDFGPHYGMVKSTQKAAYRFWHVDKNNQIQSFDFLPTVNFICADLIKAYGNVQIQQGIEIASTLLLGLVQSYTNYTETTYTGVASSTYSGVYRDAFGTGTWNGYGTSNFSAYSRTYDYSFIGERAEDLLNSIFTGSASLGQIKNAMIENGCKCP